MKFTTSISKISMATLTGVSFMLSAGANAGQLFSAAAGSEAFKSVQKAEHLRAVKPSVENAYVYRVNAKAMTKQIELNISPDLTVFAERQSLTPSASGGEVWYGKVANSTNAKGIKKVGNDDTDSVTLVNRAGMVTGTVRVDGRLFSIRPMKSGYHMVTEINENNMKPDHPEGAMAQLEQQLTEQLANGTALINQVQSHKHNHVANPDISVLVAYTPGVASEVADVPGLVDLAFAETNQGYANSDVLASASLAHLTSVSYNSVGISTDLNRLKSTSDGYMDDLHTLRATHNADIVMLLVPDSGSSCGQAAAIGATVSSAFAVTAQDCATGYYSFGHELGHLQSARHNPETDGTTTPYAYGHGYRDPQSQWRTVMAYNCSSGCTRINWWSNPDKTRNGRAMGTASVSDNSRVLSETAATVAAFSGSVTPPPPPAEPTVLSKGVAATGLAAGSGEELDFTFDVPSGASEVSFTMSGGSGDGDLYTRAGSAPTTSTYDCRPYKTGNSETCTDSSPTAGTYYAMIRAYSAFSGVSLVADYVSGSGGGSTGWTESNQSASTGNWLYYTANPGAGKSMTVTISGGSGDADLYLREGSQPTTSSYDCRPYRNGNSESCSVSNTSSSTYHIGVRAYSTFSGLSVVASW